MNANDIRSTITSTIVEALESGSGLVPWRRPWAADPNGLGLATSLSTGRVYQGINQLILQCLSMKRGYQSKWFSTFQQIKQAGASVRRGEKAVQVVLFRPVSRERIDESGEQVEDKFLVMRTFSVFNVEQTTGLDQFRIGFAQPSDTIFERFESMDRLVAAVGIDLRHGGNRAFYSPGGDYIQMPLRNQFESSETYYQTLAHEMTHWSESRIGFDRAKEDNAYALIDVAENVVSDLDDEDDRDELLTRLIAEKCDQHDYVIGVDLCIHTLKYSGNACAGFFDGTFAANQYARNAEFPFTALAADAFEADVTDKVKQLLCDE